MTQLTLAKYEKIVHIQVKVDITVDAFCSQYWEEQTEVVRCTEGNICKYYT